jgi:hypothetical protein
METMLERLKPEAAYFFAENGERSGFLFFDLKAPSDRGPPAPSGPLAPHA